MNLEPLPSFKAFKKEKSFTDLFQGGYTTARQNSIDELETWVINQFKKKTFYVFSCSHLAYHRPASRIPAQLERDYDTGTATYSVVIRAIDLKYKREAVTRKWILNLFHSMFSIVDASEEDIRCLVLCKSYLFTF